MSCCCGTLDDAKLWWGCCIHDVHGVPRVAPVAPLMTQSFDGVVASMMYMVCHELLLWHPWWHKALMELLHPWCTWCATSCCCDSRDDTKLWWSCCIHDVLCVPRSDDTKLWWSCCIHDVHGVPRVAAVTAVMTKLSESCSCTHDVRSLARTVVVMSTMYEA